MNMVMLARGRFQNPPAQNDVRAREPSRRWKARWNKWKGQAKLRGFLPIGRASQHKAVEWELWPNLVFEHLN
jgi:hypothetical protein